jgi:Fe-S cluster assembly iron-binding protein IscA
VPTAFQLTKAATTKLAQLRRNSRLPETAGLRVSSAPDATGAILLKVAFAELLAEDDLILQQGELPAFLSPELDEPLSNIVLDLRTLPDGTELVCTRVYNGERP